MVGPAKGPATIEIESYQQLKNAIIEILPNARLICLTGENGTGKTTLLRVISDAMTHLGLSSGNAKPYASDPSEDYRYSVDPSKSVVDAWSRMHNLGNVLVADGSVFPKFGSAQSYAYDHGCRFEGCS